MSEGQVHGGELPPSEIDRMFDLLEEAIEAEALSADQVDRLLGILQDAVDGTAGSDPETLAELLSMLERFLLDPETCGDVDVDGMLGLLEESLSAVADSDALAELLDTIEEGVRDPSASTRPTSTGSSPESSRCSCRWLSLRGGPVRCCRAPGARKPPTDSSTRSGSPAWQRR
jgi:hypothetical protein